MANIQKWYVKKNHLSVKKEKDSATNWNSAVVPQKPPKLWPLKSKTITKN
jgi:hypothetical protein